MKIALFNFEPNYCPSCGCASVHQKDPLGSFKYALRHTFECHCGFAYQNANEQFLLEASQMSEGDLLEKFHTDDTTDSEKAA